MPYCTLKTVSSYLAAGLFLSFVLGTLSSAMAQDNAEPVGVSSDLSDFDLEAYGSLRIHLSHASVDEAFDGGSRAYTGLTDAYSRVGARAGFDFGSSRISGNIELGLNSAELDIGDPSFFDDEDLRIKSVTAKGDWGTLKVGKDWLPYYNNVGYPVDYFSTIYAGYTTFAYFREKQVTYTTPTWKNISASLGRIERTGGGPRGWHYTAAYTADGLTVAVGREDMDNDVADTQGAAMSYTTGPWYMAAKFESSDGTGEIYNGFVQYTHDKVAYKFGLGLGDQYSGNTYHAGIDYQFKPHMKFFTEFYKEELNYAILQDRAESSSDYFGAGGFGAKQNGKVLAIGFRYDLSTNQNQ